MSQQDPQTVLNTPKPVPTEAETQAMIGELAGLQPIEYDRNRKEAASKLGISVAALDMSVKAARKPIVNSQPSMFPTVEPHPEPVVPDELVQELVAMLKVFIALSDENAFAIALWIVMTWVIDNLNVAPLLLINAPEKSCGKTQALDFVGKTAKKPLTTANVTPASMFRLIEKEQPTFLIDEADTFVKNSDDLRGIINAGHTRSSATFIRMDGDPAEPRLFNVFAAKALAGILLEQHLQDATMSRCIVIAMRRKLAGENLKRLRHADDSLFASLRSKLARFALDFGAQIHDARPELPDELSDRAQDNWEPLLAIASCGSAELFEKATQVALKLSVETESSMSTGCELLLDIQYIFETKNITRVRSSDLIKDLCEDEERPWQTYNRGKPITARQFAKHLAKYRIRSKTVRFGRETPKGFELSQFEDAFARYLSTETQMPQQGNAMPQPLPVLDSGVSDNPQHEGNTDRNTFVSSLSDADETVEETLEPLADLSCGGVADVSANFKASLEDGENPTSLTPTNNRYRNDLF